MIKQLSKVWVVEQKIVTFPGHTVYSHKGKGKAPPRTGHEGPEGK
jgi:hypothetical protein